VEGRSAGRPCTCPRNFSDVVTDVVVVVVVVAV
jgi:hypothetical protein